MEIIDAQIHEPAPPRPIDAGLGEEFELLVNVELAREAMDTVGVDVALINSAQNFMDAAVAHYPDRFAGCGRIDHRAPDVAEQVAAYRSTPGMLAIRTSISNWQNDTLLDDFVAGRMAPLFAACEASSLPLFCSTHGHAADLEPWIKKHPGLLFVVDHLGVPQPPPIKRDSPDPWMRLPGLLKLAAYDNVAVKFSGATTLSLEPYPHRDIWPALHRIIDAFTPSRLVWGSDFTRLRMAPLTIQPGPRAGWFLYPNELSYLRDTDEISAAEKEQIFGKSIRTLLRWPA